jgi:hypothetical protein
MMDEPIYPIESVLHSYRNAIYHVQLRIQGCEFSSLILNLDLADLRWGPKPQRPERGAAAKLDSIARSATLR